MASALLEKAMFAWETNPRSTARRGTKQALPYTVFQRADHPIILEGRNRPPGIRLRSFLAFAVSKDVAVVTSGLLVLFHHLAF